MIRGTATSLFFACIFSPRHQRPHFMKSENRAEREDADRRPKGERSESNLSRQTRLGRQTKPEGPEHAERETRNKEPGTRFRFFSTEFINCLSPLMCQKAFIIIIWQPGDWILETRFPPPTTSLNGDGRFAKNLRRDGNSSHSQSNRELFIITHHAKSIYNNNLEPSSFGFRHSRLRRIVHAATS